MPAEHRERLHKQGKWACTHLEGGNRTLLPLFGGATPHHWGTGPRHHARDRPRPVRLARRGCLGARIRWAPLPCRDCLLA